jgi:hypothetical protein
MKTTIDLPDELIRTIKIRAVSQGKPLKDLVAELLTEALYAPKSLQMPYTASEPRAPYVLDHQGFPVVNGHSNAPSTRASLQETLDIEQKALNDEDIGRASTSN